MTFPDITPELKSQRLNCAAGCSRTSRSPSSAWFRVGGPAQALFMPEDEADLAYVLRATCRLKFRSPCWARAPT